MVHSTFTGTESARAFSWTNLSPKFAIKTTRSPYLFNAVALSIRLFRRNSETWVRDSLWSARELEIVVSHLQSLDPPGIGARSLQECLLLQLPPQTLPTLLVQDYLEDLAACIDHSLEAKQNRERLLEKLQNSLYETPKNRHLTSLALIYSKRSKG